MSESSEAEPVVVALCVDLMDRSKLSGALPDLRVVRSVDALRAALDEAAPASTVALVDLSRVDDSSVLADLPGRVIAFGSHVNEDVLAAATEAGAEALPRSVFFRRLGDTSLI